MDSLNPRGLPEADARIFFSFFSIQSIYQNYYNQYKGFYNELLLYLDKLEKLFVYLA